MGYFYCKNANPTEDYSRISFDFHGYTFRPRRCVNTEGQVHTNFLLAISRDSMKEINRRIRNWRIQLKNENTLLDFSRIFNPILRGWYAYFGRFYPSALGSIWNNINRYLIRWVCRKFKRFFRHKKRARRFLDRFSHIHSDLFIHWRLGVFPLG